MGTYRDFTVQQAVTPGASAVNITNTNTTNDECRAVYVGASGNYKFYINGAWVQFNGTNAGSILPIRATGAVDAADDSAPGSNEIIFIY
jgi:hypothetical protein|tara:strand:- start:334 stop:600 length:267 start_codon:yes stop_codon:yes gene_type:complete